MINSIYIHIPFCRKICSYCDFCKMYYYEDIASKYLDTLEKEIANYDLKGTYKTLYIGGGTPSALSIDNLNKLFAITRNIKLSSDYEFTFECNIDDISKEKLELLKENRVNRLSIGVETTNDKLQKLINRSHTKEEISTNINLAKEYFSNINIDLIYAIPGETIDILKDDLDFITSFEPNHLSIYSLIIEEHTKLFIDKTLPIDEELDNKMYYFIIDYLSKKGYHHYETSNFSKEGNESKHNLTYWNNEGYYGFGMGASGFIDKYRYTNTRSINKYLNNNYLSSKEILDEKIMMQNEMILGLRKTRGVDLTKFKEKYHKDVKEVFDIDRLINEKLLEINDNYIYIPKDKIYISNYILCNFIDN